MPVTARTRRLTAALAVTTALVVGATACGGTTKDDANAADKSAAKSNAAGKADPDAAIKKGLTVAFLPKQVNNPYFTTSDNGGKKVLQELGSTYKEVGTSSGTDTAGQVS